MAYRKQFLPITNVEEAAKKWCVNQDNGTKVVETAYEAPAPGGKIIQRQMGEIDAMKLKKIIALYPGR
jgi:hypothetical protein